MSELFTEEIATDTAAQQRVRDWIAALRSGNYEQTKERLRDDFGFCCLGVACDIQDKENWLLRDAPATIGKHWLWDSDYEVLPEQAMRLYHLSDRYGRFRQADGGLTELVQVNDSGGTFDEIADIIERELTEALAA